MFYGGNVVRVLLHFFFHCRSFSPFLSPPYKIFMLFFKQKNYQKIISRSRSLSPSISVLQTRGHNK